MHAPNDKLQVMGSCMYTCERVRHSEAQLRLIVMYTIAFYEPSQTMVYTIRKITKHLHLNHMIPKRTEEVQTNIQRHQARETKARTNCSSKKHENVSRQACCFLELKIQQLLTKKYEFKYGIRDERQHTLFYIETERKVIKNEAGLVRDSTVKRESDCMFGDLGNSVRQLRGAWVKPCMKMFNKNNHE